MGKTACRRVPGQGDRGLHAGLGAPRVDTVHVEMKGQFPRIGWKYVQGPIVNEVYPCCPLFVFGIASCSWPGWTGEEVSFWTRLPHCSGVVSDEEVESCPKRARRQPDDHYGRGGGGGGGGGGGCYPIDRFSYIPSEVPSPNQFFHQELQTFAMVGFVAMVSMIISP